MLKKVKRTTNRQKLRDRLRKGTATTTEEKKFLQIDGLMYYLSGGDAEGPRLRFYVLRELESLVLQQPGRTGTHRSRQDLRRHQTKVLYAQPI